MTGFGFHPLVLDYFNQRFEAPTPVQKQGWEALAARKNVLLCAPTGSGKTLAAFLLCLDRLIHKGYAGGLEDHAQVVYVSPLKALSHDIRKNVQEPLSEMAALARLRGDAFPEIRLGLRTGDTPASERRALVKKPPHIWITTPESLYILLGSESGRASLRSVHTLIIDEIHALAGNKRGAHLALSVERLEALAGTPLLRIGLSATVRPIEEVARFLVGTTHIRKDGTPECVLVDHGRRRPFEPVIHLPKDELTHVASHELWKEILDAIAALVKKERTTLVFVNTRRLVEKTAHQLSMRLGEDAVVAHHGSLSRKVRLDAEHRLKKGEVKVCVATASLELGIDVGFVDLVCQIGSPQNVAVFIQRIGRSGHGVGRIPRGVLFPLTRDELTECAALTRMAIKGDLEVLSIPPWPLDVLAQQVVAACAAEPWGIDDLYERFRRAWPYRDLPRQRFDQIIDNLSEGYALPQGRKYAYLHRDGVHRRVRGRRNARLTALISGGAIPDNADYDVIREPEGLFVGRVHEDFAVESMGGDVFLLGNTSWRIRRVEKGRVLVEDAQGAAPNIPFWLGEAPGRSHELSIGVGEVREAMARLLPDAQAATDWLVEHCPLSREAAAEIVRWHEEGVRVLGVIPTHRHIVAERFFDESGGMQLIIHAPFGARINRAWGFALRKRFCRHFDFELQAAATDDGINLSLGPQHSFPVEDIFRFLRPGTVEEVLTQALLQSPIFVTRWRWTASRALAIVRQRGSKRVPAPIQRMMSEDLLAGVFPAQAGCQDNRAVANVELPDHPLVFETMRDCLHEAVDVEGLKSVLGGIEAGTIRISGRDTVQPSVFSHQILNAMPYAFLDDAPLEERRARAVLLRRALPESAADLGRLDPNAIQAAIEDAWPVVRDKEELHDVLLSLILVPRAWVAERFGAHAPAWFEALVHDGRARIFRNYLVASERLELAARVLDGDEEAASILLRAYVEISGPFEIEVLATSLGLPSAILEISAARLESEGLILQGAFTRPGAREWCDRRILARIHRATLGRLRREIEPVSLSVFMRFLLEWQNVKTRRTLSGPEGILEALGVLQGYEAPAEVWEGALLPARVSDYRASDLDRLCMSGDVVWGRFSPRAHSESGRRGVLTRASLIGLGFRDDLEWLTARCGEMPDVSGKARRVLEVLQAGGAVFVGELPVKTGMLRAEIEEALGELALSGYIACDGFAHIRRVIRGASAERRGRKSRFTRRRLPNPLGAGRWWCFERPEMTEAHVEARAGQLLRRYGVVFRDLLGLEPDAWIWRRLLVALRRAEGRGEIRGGRFVEGRVGEQFALPEAVEMLRKLRREASEDRILEVSACDPLNLTGFLLPGPRVAASPRRHLALHDGVPVAWWDTNGELNFLPGVEARIRKRVLDSALGPVSVRPSPEPAFQ